MTTDSVTVVVMKDSHFELRDLKLEKKMNKTLYHSLIDKIYVHPCMVRTAILNDIIRMGMVPSIINAWSYGSFLFLLLLLQVV